MRFCFFKLIVKGAGQFRIGFTFYIKGQRVIHLVRKIFWKSNISYPLIHTRTCVSQGIRNVGFSENHAYIPNEWPLNKNHNYGVVLENVDFNIDSSSRGKLLVVTLQVLNISDPSFKISCLVTIIFEGLILNS